MSVRNKFRTKSQESQDLHPQYQLVLSQINNLISEPSIKIKYLNRTMQDTVDNTNNGLAVWLGAQKLMWIGQKFWSAKQCETSPRSSGDQRRLRMWPLSLWPHLDLSNSHSLMFMSKLPNLFHDILPLHRDVLFPLDCPKHSVLLEAPKRFWMRSSDSCVGEGFPAHLSNPRTPPKYPAIQLDSDFIYLEIVSDAIR